MNPTRSSQVAPVLLRELKERFNAISDQPLNERLETLSRWMKAHPWVCMGAAVGAGFALGIGGSPARLLRIGGAAVSVGFDVAARLALLEIANGQHAPQSPTDA